MKLTKQQKNNLAIELLMELEDLQASTLGLSESLALMNRALNAARQLAVAEIEEDSREAA